MNLFTKIKYAFSTSYDAFLSCVAENDRDGALYYVGKLTKEDVNRPIEAKDASAFYQLYNGVSLLMLVAEREDAVLLERLLAMGANPYYQASKYRQPIFRNAFNYLRQPDLWAVFAPYFDNGHSLNEKGDNLLMYWCKQQDFTADDLQWIISSVPEKVQSTLDYHNNDGYSLLTYLIKAAFTRSDDGKLDAFLKAMALHMRPDLSKSHALNVNQKDAGGRLPSLMLLNDKRPETLDVNADRMKLLINAGMDVNECIYTNEPLLIVAIREGYCVGHKMFQTILEQTDVDLRTSSGVTALRLAARQSDYATVLTLMQTSTDIQSNDEYAIVSGILENENIRSDEKVYLLESFENYALQGDIKNNMPGYVAKALEEIYPGSENTSFVKLALQDNAEQLALFLMDRQFSPFDATENGGKASDELDDTHGELKALVLSYEAAWTERQNTALAEGSIAKETEHSNHWKDNLWETGTFFEEDGQYKVSLWGIFGHLIAQLSETDRNKFFQNQPISAQGIHKIQRVQHEMNRVVHCRAN